MTVLEDHRLARIDPVVLGTRYPRTVGRNARLGSHGPGPDAAAVRLTTDTGATGWGLVDGPLDRALDGARALLGRSVGDLIDPDVGVTDEALVLDLALHDLAGHLLGVPVWRMLGGRGTSAEPAGAAVSCYDGAIYFDDLDPDDAPRGVAAVLAEVEHDRALGHRAFKLKIGRGSVWMPPDEGLARDVEVTRAVAAAHPDCRVLVDANDGYAPEGFLRYLDGVAGDVDLFWVEEPFAEHEEGLRVLREGLERHGATTLIADGEHDPDVGRVRALAEAGLLDVLLMDVLSYGFTPWRRLLRELEGGRVLASPHAWGLPVKTLYAAQLAAGAGGVLTVEGVPGETLGADTSAYRLEEGRLHLPEEPGFGIPLTASG